MKVLITQGTLPEVPLVRLLQTKAGNTHCMGGKHPKCLIMCTPCGKYIALQHTEFPKGFVFPKGAIVEKYWEPFTGTVQLSN